MDENCNCPVCGESMTPNEPWGMINYEEPGSKGEFVHSTCQ